MSATNERLSVPTPRTSAPRPVTEVELATLEMLADLLCGPSLRAEPPSQQSEYPHWLDVALATRSESFERIISLAARAAEVDNPQLWLRELHDNDAEAFQALSAVLGGAYLMVPAVREAVGYPGQRRDPVGIEEAVDEISDGILDPVLERGYFFVPTPKVG